MISNEDFLIKLIKSTLNKTITWRSGTEEVTINNDLYIKSYFYSNISIKESVKIYEYFLVVNQDSDSERKLDYFHNSDNNILNLFKSLRLIINKSQINEEGNNGR